MTLRSSFKYWAFMRLAFREVRAAPAELLGSVVFLWVILGIFSALWRAVAELGPGYDVDPRRMVWYLAVTEWLVLSLPGIHFQIAEDVRRGDVAYQLARPLSYLGAWCVRALGQLALRAVVLAPAALLGALAFSGGVVDHAERLLLVAVFGAAALVVATLFRVLLGLAAFVIDDVMPLHWVWQKLAFILGGLMLPLAFLPEPLARAAGWTPFRCTIYAPAALLLEEVHSLTRLAGELAVWFAVAVLLAMACFELARRRLEVNGG